MGRGFYKGNDFGCGKLPDTPEDVERQRVLTKLPDYVHSFSGFYIFEHWHRANRLSRSQAQILIIMSYHTHMFWLEFKAWYMATDKFAKAMTEMVKYGYVTKITVPSKTKGKTREAYALTPMGKALEKDYEKFYDTKIAELEGKVKPKRYKIDRTDYFRMCIVPKKVRRDAQGGGRLPLGLNPLKDRVMLRKDVTFEGWPPVKWPEDDSDLL